MLNMFKNLSALTLGIIITFPTSVAFTAEGSMPKPSEGKAKVIEAQMTVEQAKMNRAQKTVDHMNALDHALVDPADPRPNAAAVKIDKEDAPEKTIIVTDVKDTIGIKIQYKKGQEMIHQWFIYNKTTGEITVRTTGVGKHDSIQVKPEDPSYQENCLKMLTAIDKAISCTLSQSKLRVLNHARGNLPSSFVNDPVSIGTIV
jgi:hypothetical protein